MKRFVGVALAVGMGWVAGVPARAEDAGAIVDRAIKALGGEEALKKAGTATWKTKGVLTINGNENDFTTETTADGLERHKTSFEGNFNGNDFRVDSVRDGDKGWRKFGDQVMEMDADAIANEKRTTYLQIVPSTLVALKGKDFKTEAADEESVGGKPAAVVQVTGPDGKDFTLWFDKESGLPVKLVADVVGFMGEPYTQEVAFADYKDFGGIKRATKVEIKRDGEPLLKQQVTDFEVLEKVPAGTFSEPN